ncbi:hypothetical protein [Ornithinimicrobium kibberense]|uniref:hypothetical protein n=1 Tax=Ornithinimicrobium kibberense TaxID=282060 RepID=UPI0036120FDB
MPSIARAAAMTGSVISLVSCPAQPSPSSHTPRWTCASTRPGTSQPPEASTTSASPGTVTSSRVPTASIRPSRSSTTPSGTGSEATGTTWAPTMASGWSWCMGRAPPGTGTGSVPAYAAGPTV